MYEHLFHSFGLRENPFHVSPDPRFYFSTRAHDRALAELEFGVDSRQGFIVLTGEAGTGKTTLLNHFLNWLAVRGQSSSYVFHAVLKPVELLEFILHDFGVRAASREKGDLLATLENFLIERHRLGDSPVVIIDEAQAISVRTLDQLRLLLNMEVPGAKLLQIVLAGQPELEEKLRRPELRQLAQRVMFRCGLQALSMDETAEYVMSRCAAAGAATKIFSPESLELVSMYSRGIPRTVNLVCEHALIAAYSARTGTVTPEMIRRVAVDFDLTAEPVLAEERKEARFEGLAPTRVERVGPTPIGSEARAAAVANMAAGIAARTGASVVFGLGPRGIGPGHRANAGMELQMVDRIVLERATADGLEMVSAEGPSLVTEERIELGERAEDKANEAEVDAVTVEAAPEAAVESVVKTEELESPAELAREVEKSVDEFDGEREAAPASRAAAAAASAAGAAMPHLVASPSAMPVPMAAPAASNAVAMDAGAVRVAGNAVARNDSAHVVSTVARNRSSEAVALDAVPAPKGYVVTLAKPVAGPPKRMTVRWKEPGIAERFLAYWGAVGLSFLKDWRDFVGAHGPAGMVKLQRNVIVPMKKWLQEPVKNGGRKRA